MYKGFYNSVSGMLTQQRILNTISNNLTNASTPGFKKDLTTSTTFNEVLTYRLGNVDKRRPSELGELGAIRTVDARNTIYEQGGVTATGRAFDFAIAGEGFFEIETADGTVYTRNGAFTLDAQGYLYLQGGGRVLGTGGAINLGTDQFTVNPDGTILLDNGGTAGQIRIVDFADYETLTKNEQGFFVGEGGVANNGEVTVVNNALEESNVNVIQETVNMIETQRAFQSASQIFRMYDQLNEKSDELGRV